MNRNFTFKYRGWRARAGIALPVLLVALALQAPAWAKHKKVMVPLPQQQVESPPRSMAEVSQDRIVSAAEKRHGAKVVKVEEGTHKGKRVYVLRLLSKEGRVWTIKVDPETGGEI